jgi:biotin synthase
VEGTPLADRPLVDPIELVRVVATARILMPAARVRLSAGRTELSREAQLLCFLAGANSIFYGEKLLTTGNPDVEADRALLRDAGLSELGPSAHTADVRPSEAPQCKEAEAPVAPPLL